MNTARNEEQGPLKITGDWDMHKANLQSKYPQLTDDDLRFSQGREDDLIRRLGDRLNKSREDVTNILRKCQNEVSSRSENQGRSGSSAGNTGGRANENWSEKESGSRQQTSHQGGNEGRSATGGKQSGNTGKDTGNEGWQGSESGSRQQVSQQQSGNQSRSGTQDQSGKQSGNPDKSGNEGRSDMNKRR
ncbi:MAG: hypothetical protein ACT6QS_15505 [Flavobacteriales bacterium]